VTGLEVGQRVRPWTAFGHGWPWLSDRVPESVTDFDEAVWLAVGVEHIPREEWVRRQRASRVMDLERDERHALKVLRRHEGVPG
jgi:hypothetical protein